MLIKKILSKNVDALFESPDDHLYFFAENEISDKIVKVDDSVFPKHITDFSKYMLFSSSTVFATFKDNGERLLVFNHPDAFENVKFTRIYRKIREVPFGLKGYVLDGYNFYFEDSNSSLDYGIEGEGASEYSWVLYNELCDLIDKEE